MEKNVNEEIRYAEPGDMINVFVKSEGIGPNITTCVVQNVTHDLDGPCEVTVAFAQGDELETGFLVRACDGTSRWDAQLTASALSDEGWLRQEVVRVTKLGTEY